LTVVDWLESNQIKDIGIPYLLSDFFDIEKIAKVGD
jgi:hypothetical protein